MPSTPTATTSPSVKARLLEDLGRHEGCGLAIGGVPAEDLAHRFGTPTYVYDAAILERNLGAVRRALGPRVEVLFALKANPSAAVASVLRRAGAGCEVASAGEIHVALAAGFAGGQVHFAGPGKHGADLDVSLSNGVFSLNVESVAEYEAIAELAQRRGVRQGVSIRINPKESAGGSRMRMGGASKKFGVDVDAVPALLRRIQDEGSCELRGLHVYAGTQTFDAAAWLVNARALVHLAAELERTTGAEIRTLNFGGGLGVPVFDGDATFDLGAVGEGVQELIRGDARPERRYFVELGRYLVATAGVFLTRVVYLKESGSKSHAILDGGMHSHSAAAGVGSVIRRPYPVVVARAPHAEGTQKYTLGGPLCTPADEFAGDIALPALRQGDVLAILCSGAYGLTFSNVLFLSHPTPGEVLVKDGVPHLIREPGRPEDALRGQRLPHFLEGV